MLLLGASEVRKAHTSDKAEEFLRLSAAFEGTWSEHVLMFHLLAGLGQLAQGHSRVITELLSQESTDCRADSFALEFLPWLLGILAFAPWNCPGSIRLTSVPASWNVTGRLSSRSVRS